MTDLLIFETAIKNVKRNIAVFMLKRNKNMAVK